jgi:ATP-dependent DNA helicase RecQ
LLREDVTVVVSPLIALMRNQVAHLHGFGIAAASLNSANDATENRSVLDRIARGELRLAYVAPERLVKAETLNLFKRAKVTLLAVDSAPGQTACCSRRCGGADPSWPRSNASPPMSFSPTRR